MGTVSHPPSAEFVVRFQWFVGGKVLLCGDGVREGDRLRFGQYSREIARCLWHTDFLQIFPQVRPRWLYSANSN